MEPIGILWDLDGTLLNTLDDLRDAVNYALAQFHCPPRAREEVRRFVGNGAGQLIRLSLPGLPGDPEPEAVLAVFREYYSAHCQVKTRPYDGIPDALAALGDRFPMAIVSNKPDAAVKILCEDYFGAIHAQGEHPGLRRKPAPDMVFAAMADLGVAKCIYVGDSEVDVLTASNAGIPCLSVLWGFRGREELLRAGAKHFCHTPAALPETIEQLAGEIYGK